MGDGTKKKALEPASFREENFVNESQRKAKSKYGICAGFLFDSRGHKAKRSDAHYKYKYNYIYNYIYTQQAKKDNGDVLLLPAGFTTRVDHQATDDRLWS